MSDVSTREKQDEAALADEQLKKERLELLQRLEDSVGNADACPRLHMVSAIGL